MNSFFFVADVATISHWGGSKYIFTKVCERLGILQGQIGIWLNPNDGICRMRSTSKHSWKNEDFLGHHIFIVPFLVKFHQTRKMQCPKKNLHFHWMFKSSGKSQFGPAPVEVPQAVTKFLLWKSILIWISTYYRYRYYRYLYILHLICTNFYIFGNHQ